MKKLLLFVMLLILIAGGAYYLYDNAPYKSNNIALQWITEKKLTYQAENGSDDAQYKLALEIISQEHLDNKQAIPWLKKAADSKHIKAHLILLSLSDKQLTPQATLDMVNSIKAQSDIESHYQLSVIINDLPDQPDGLAIDLMKKAAEGSHVEAQLTLAKHYHRLNKYSKYSDQEFRYLTQKWFEKAADAGNAEAQYNLGYLYLYHQYENFGSKDAYALFEKSANQGNAEAQYQLGSRYFFSGPEQNESQAMLWYQKAAEGGHPEAQMKLGSTYYYGSSVIKKDEEFGLKWIELAAEQGEPEAKDLLERIQK